MGEVITFVLIGIANRFGTQIVNFTEKIVNNLETNIVNDEYLTTNEVANLNNYLDTIFAGFLNIGGATNTGATNTAALIAAIAAIAATSDDRNLPIINSIKQIKREIQENPDLPSEEKSNLQVDLTSLETEINKLYSLYNTISSATVSGLPFQLVALINTLKQDEPQIQQELQKLVVQYIQSQIQLRQQIRQEERFLPLLNLIIPLIDTFKQ